VLIDTECLRGVSLPQTDFLGHELPPPQIDAPPVPKMATAGEKAEIDQLSTFHKKTSPTSFRFFFATLSANEAGQKKPGLRHHAQPRRL
jgi:hypothetical protein